MEKIIVIIGASGGIGEVFVHHYQSKWLEKGYSLTANTAIYHFSNHIATVPINAEKPSIFGVFRW